MTPEQRRMRARIAAHARWARVADRSAATEVARSAALRRFETEVDPDGVLSPAERHKRARNAQSAHMAKMSYARSRKRAS
jgi:hypothetical protein